MQNCSIYKIHNSLYIHSTSVTLQGVGLASEPYFKLSVDASEQEKSNCILAALNSSQVGVPHPTNWSEFRKKYFQSLGVKNHAYLHKGSLAIILRDKENIQCLPYKNLGAKQGFIPLNAKILTFSINADLININSLLEQTFHLCE